MNKYRFEEKVLFGETRIGASKYDSKSVIATFLFTPEDWDFLVKYKGEPIFLKGDYYKIAGHYSLDAIRPKQNFRLELTLNLDR